ncbi:MAG: hypothetical protein JXB32_05690 [Deltaproteobacteria bacterium]|nr:hypothetical protein [Deltaproteobacteria bacterium]
MYRIAAAAAVVLALAAALVAARVWFVSRAEWRAGEALVAEYNLRVGEEPPPGEGLEDPRRALLREAIVRYREAALWYLPGNPYGRRAVERLLLIGQRGEQDADDDLALYAYRAARSAIQSTRSLVASDADGLSRADRGIARVSARLERPVPGAEPLTPTEREKRHRALLAAGTDPDPWLSLLAAVGLLLWVVGAFVFALRGLDERGRLRLGPALRAGFVVAAGVAAWLAGLALA